MPVWETEDEGVLGSPNLPTPANTPIRTPSRESRRSRRSTTPPGIVSSSPMAMPGTDRTDRSSYSNKRSSRDITNDENISILDPRRFTPTLHANLVSEILNLRRDQEEKTKAIERLENSLHIAKEEEATLRERLSDTSKNHRTLKRQISLLEGGSSSALSELSRQRDEAVEATSEARKRLEAVQKRLKVFEDDAEKIHDLWESDKNKWDNEKRQYERRLHVAEARLKTILDEVAAQQALEAHTDAPATGAGIESDLESVRDNDAGSIRSMSMTNSIRFSSLASKALGASLADELNFDGDSDDQTDPEGRESVLSHRPLHLRANSRDSLLSKTHDRHRSTDSLIRPGSVGKGRLQSILPAESLAIDAIKEDDEMQTPVIKSTYTDSSTQYTPPPSPVLQPTKSTTPEPFTVPLAQLVESPEANQRRKRVSVVGRPLTIQSRASSKNAELGAKPYDGPLSPPKTPKSPFHEALPSPVAPEVKATASVGTQTEVEQAGPELTNQGAKPENLAATVSPEALAIPSISIHPPLSRPTTPREPLLPQLTKDFGCQASLTLNKDVKEAGVQTEEIRVDTRLDRLPAHLHPSAIKSRPNTPGEDVSDGADMDRHFTPIPGNLPPRNPRRLTSQRSSATLGSSPPVPSSYAADSSHIQGEPEQRAPSHHRISTRKSNRMSNWFSGFDGGSSDELDDFADVDVSDSEYRTALSAPRPTLRSPDGSRRGSETGGSRASPEYKKSSVLPPPRGNRRSIMRPQDIDVDVANYGPRMSSRLYRKSSGRGGTASRGASRLVNGGNTSPMRKSAMIQNGMASHQHRKSPTRTSPQRKPPFPIPVRASSKQPIVTGDEDIQELIAQTPTKKGPWMLKAKPTRIGHQRTSSIRKVKPATTTIAAKEKPRAQKRSRSPPPQVTNTEQIDDMPPPPLPINDITSPRTPHNANNVTKRHRHQPSDNTAATDFTGGHRSQPSQSSSQAASTVVDAIAQTMVGEWMFKYVRRRKSFGVGNDGIGKDDSSNDRHKRWVWLAPYDRAILWSNKQPSSGSALLGKSGRKLTIQSVLDVKDDNAPPKGSDEIFNRSILILTPQRALKFTAVNAERHYVWLNALSFLAHSQQDVPDIPALPPMPMKQIPEFQLPKPKARRAGLRDSIRIAKGKGDQSVGSRSVSSSQAGGGLPSIPDQPPSVISYPAPSDTSMSIHRAEMSRDAAEPPTVPRFNDRGPPPPNHLRKRSNTAGHVPPPLSFRGFTSSTAPSHSSGSRGPHYQGNSKSSNGTGGGSSFDHGAGSSQGAGNSVNGASWGAMSSVAETRPDSFASSAQPGSSNFFDAIGTVRMEAFISPLAFTKFEVSTEDFERSRREQFNARRRSKEIRRRRSRSRHRDGGTGYARDGSRADEEYSVRDDSRTGDEKNYFKDYHPFEGFSM